VSPNGATNGPISGAVGEVRSVTPFRLQVGGDLAETVDYRHGLEARLPFAMDRGHRDTHPVVPHDRLGGVAVQGDHHERAVARRDVGALVGSSRMATSRACSGSTHPARST
jgi:hypothetical protein